MARQAADELIADFLLRYYRQPARLRAEARRATHLFGNLDTVLRLALGRKVEFASPALRGPAATAELRRAAVFCIQQQFFRDDATHYEVLGLPTDASAEAVRENFRLLMQLIHPDRQGVSATWSEASAARVNRAHAVLKGLRTRVEYDRAQEALRARESAARIPLPVRARPRPRPRAAPRRRQTYVPMLPEWMTVHVGGFAWRHPGVVAFAGLIVASTLIVVASVWLETDRLSAGEAAYTSRQTASPPAMERAASASSTGTVERATPIPRDAVTVALPEGVATERNAGDDPNRRDEDDVAVRRRSAR